MCLLRALWVKAGQRPGLQLPLCATHLLPDYLALSGHSGAALLSPPGPAFGPLTLPPPQPQG